MTDEATKAAALLGKTQILASLLAGVNDFNPEYNDFSIHKSKLSNIFELAGIEENNLKVGSLVKTLHESAHKALLELCSPDKPEDKTYKELIDMLEIQFTKTKVVFLERKNFYKAEKKSDESVAEWHGRIKKLAVDCKFGDQLDSILVDKFVTGFSGKIFERLCEEKLDGIKLAKVLEIALKSEVKLENSSAQLKKIHQKQPHFKKQTSSNQAKSNEQFKCYRCNYTNHNAKDCKFKNSRCNTCGKVGHLEKACRSKNEDRQPKEKSYEKSADSKVVSKLEALVIRQISIGDAKEPLMVEVLVNGKLMRMEIDSGAAVSVINEATYTDKFNNYNLDLENVEIYTYSGQKVGILGSFNPIIEYEGKSNNIKIFVVKGRNSSILGRDFLKEFNFEIKMINKIDKDPGSFMPRLEEFLKKYDNLFNDDQGEYKFKRISLELKDKNVKPIFVKPRPIPFAYKESVEKELLKMESKGIIKRVDNSKWGTPIVPVPKADGSVRICGDFRSTINPHLENFNHPLPRAEDIFEKVGDGPFLGKIDLKSAFYQFVLDEKSQEMCSLSTPFGIFRMIRLPPGVKPASQDVQCEMEKTFMGIEGVAVFQDDIFFSAPTWNQFQKILELVFERVEKAGLKLRRDKCEFLVNELHCLGHIISSKGLSKDRESVKVFETMKEPEFLEEVQALSGLVNYYGKFVKGLAEIMKPIYTLLKGHQNVAHGRKKIKIDWNDECREAFAKLKLELAKDISLAKYNGKDQLILTTDASFYSISGVLETVHNGIKRPVKCVSRSLGDAEIKYSAIDKEALAIVFSLKKLDQFLLGRTFTLRTDQKALVRIFGPSKGTPILANQRIQRWAMYLQGFQYEIEYVNTKQNIADSFSRMKYSEYEDTSIENEKIFLNRLGEIDLPLSLEDIKEETANDAVLSKLMEALSNEAMENLTESQFQPYVRRVSEIAVVQGIVLWNDRVVIPSTMRNLILKQLHITHLGTSKMKSIARSYFWWPGLDKEIEEITKSCSACKENSNSPEKAPLIPWKITKNVWSRIHLDYAGPKWGFYFLIIVDSRSKWLEVFKTKTITAEFTIEKTRETLARHGLCDICVSDNGSQFTSKEFRDFLNANGVIQRLTPPGYPKTNGQAENSVRTVKNALFRALQETNATANNVEQALQAFLLDYRNTSHSSTGKSPAEALFNRKLKTRFDLIHPLKAGKELEITEKEKGSKENQISNYKGNRNIVFDIGQSVKVKDYSDPNKFKWINATVNEVLGRQMVMVKLENGRLIKRHVDQIIPFKKPLISPTIVTTNFVSPSVDQSASQGPSGYGLRDRSQIQRPARYGN